MPGIEVRAVLTIKKAGELTSAEQRTLADWLKDQAKSLMKDGDNYSSRFIARFYARKAER